MANNIDQVWSVVNQKFGFRYVKIEMAIMQPGNINYEAGVQGRTQGYSKNNIQLLVETLFEAR